MATERARSKVGLVGKDNWQVGWNHEVDACMCVWHKVGVVDIENNIELHESGQGSNHLLDETIQAGVGGRERSADEEVRNSQESKSSSRSQVRMHSERAQRPRSGTGCSEERLAAGEQYVVECSGVGPPRLSCWSSRQRAPQYYSLPAWKRSTVEVTVSAWSSL